MPVLFLIFLVIPIVEIALFIQVGEWIGLWPTLASILATALIGSAIVRHQGMQTLARARQSMELNQMPVREAATGLALLVAGFLLITPGFFTDTLGFLLLIPAVRGTLGAWLAGQVLAGARVQVFRSGPVPGTGPRGRGDGVIDGEYEDLTDQPQPPGSDNASRHLPPGDGRP